MNDIQVVADLELDNLLLFDQISGYTNLKTKIFLWGKCLFDLITSLFALVFLFPLLAIVWFLVYLEEPSVSPIFSQERCGVFGKRFKIYKFRSMVPNAEKRLEELIHLNEVHGPAFKIKDDPRITRLGRFLRKTCIDELPQLYNILIGDMSFVGPRPPLPKEVAQYTSYQTQRLSVTPGLTCFWQTANNRHSLSFDEWVELDLQYIRERSWLLDIKLVLKTIWVIMKADGQ